MCEQQGPGEINDVCPTSLNHLVGQRSVVNQVSVAIDAAFADAKKMDHAILVGPPGLGKSAVAEVIAKEMAANLHRLFGQSITSPADLNGLILGVKERDVVFIDEVHELKKEYQTALYLALDHRKIIVPTSGRSPEAIPIADFTLLLATTDEFSVLAPLRDRMKLTLRFDFYEAEELTTILVQRSRALGWSVEKSVFPIISERSRGTPRLALRLLQSCRRVSRAEGDTVITLDHLCKACCLEQTDCLGLDPTEQKYLGFLAEGANRLNTIASILGLPARTVVQVIEPYLFRVGLIVKDDQGRRQFTAKGRGHLSNSRQDPV